MTELVYLEDTFKLTDEATVLSVGEDDRGRYCVLDRTVFYPQGGGQPADTGALFTGGSEHLVSFVAMFGGEVRHYIQTGDDALVGQKVRLEVRESPRLKHAKAHTAGHLLQCVVDNLEVGIVAIKGYHFPDGSYVEFQGKPTVERDELISRVNSELSKLLSAGGKIEAKRVNPSEIEDLLARLPYDVPKDKPLRVVQIEGFDPVPCGGTHLKALSDLESVEVRKVKSKSGNTKISYAFA